MSKWKKVNLDSICEKKITTLSTKEDFLIDYIDIASIDNKTKQVTSYQTLNAFEAPSRARQILQEDDILVSTVRPNLNAVAVNNIKSDNIVVGSTGYCVLRCKPGIDKGYIFHYCKSITFVNNLTRIARGASYPAVSNSDVRNSLIPLPPYEIQKSISKTLDLVSDILMLRKQQLVELDELIKSLFYKIFGNPIANEKGWKKSCLSNECGIITGNTPPRKNKENYGDFIEWIKSDNITSQSIYLSQAIEYLSKEGSKVGRFVDSPSILMTCIAGSIKSIGNVAIANRKVAFNQQINAIIPNNHNIYFLYSLFQVTQKYIQSSISMNLKGIISKSKLSSLEFIFPPREVQNQFASYFLSIQEQRNLVVQAINDTQHLMDSLMSEYFE